MILNMRKLLDDLKWQIEAGIDVTIGDKPNNKFYQEEGNNQNHTNENSSKSSEIFENNSLNDELKTIKTLEELKKILKENNFCNLQKSSKNLIFSDGDSNSNIMVISNNPDSSEDNLGKPLVEKNGELFNNILSAAGLSRSSVYITPVIPWKIPGERDLTLDEKNTLLPILKKHIEIINPKILILLGSDPLKYLLDDDDGMMKKRGKWLNYIFGEQSLPCLTLLDPGFLIRRPEYKRETWKDVLNLKDKIEELL